MAGKPATIGDLFAPMQSIQICMESKGTEINDNLVSINHAVLNCAGALSDGNRILKQTVKDFKKTIDGSLKSLNEAAKQQDSAGAASGAGMAAAVTGSISSGFDSLSAVMTGVSQQLGVIAGYVKNIEVRVRGKFSVADTLRDKSKEVIGEMKAKKTAEKINVPDVTGGKGAGDLAKALADAARVIDGISYRKSIMIKMKAAKIIGGLLDVFEDKKKQLNAAAMKKNEAVVKNLAEISGSLSVVTKKMAGLLPLAPFAILGAKLTGKVIKSVLNAIRPLDDPLDDVKSLKKTATAAKNLELIATSMLKFNAAMALNLILAVPAMAGAAATFVVLGGSLFLFNLLGKRAVSRDLRQAAINLNLMSLGIVTFTLSLLASTMIMKYLLFGTDNKFNPANLKSLGSTVLVYGVMLGTLALYSLIGSGKTAKDVWFGAAAIGVMSGGLILFSLSLLTSYMITKAIIGNVMADGKIDAGDIISLVSAVPMFLLMYGAAKLYGRIGTANNTRRVINGGLAVVMMSLGFITFGAAFYIVHQITRSVIGDWKGKQDIGALVMDVGIFALMFGGLWLYRRIGAPANTRNVVNGGLSIFMMSAGFIIFSAALYISHMITKDMWKSENGKMDWNEMFKTVAVFGLMYGATLIFKKIGKNAKEIALGAAASLAMSAGVAAFGFGLMFLTVPIKNNKPADLWLGPGLLGAFAFEFGIMGLGLVPAAIALGAAASVAIAGGIAAFGLGLKNMTESMTGIDMKTANSYADIIKNFALKFRLIGMPVVTPLIIRGAAAMIAAGGAVSALGKALGEWKNVSGDGNKVDLDFLCKCVDRIKLAFQGMPEGERDKKSILKGVSSAIFAPFNMATIMTSSAALAAASAAIRELAKGIMYWKAADVKDNDIKSIVTSIGSVYTAFGQMGAKSEKPGGSLLKSLIGIDLSGLSPSDVEIGIRSSKKIGDALLSISKGLMEFYNGIGSNFKDPAFMESFATSVANVVGGLSAVFSEIGADQVMVIRGRAKNKVTWMGDAFNEITKTSMHMKSKNAVKEGVKAVKDLGQTIKDIAIGLKEFKDLVPSGNSAFIINVASGLAALLEGLTGPLIAFGTTEESFSAAATKASAASARYSDALSSVQTIAAQTTNYEHHKVDIANAMKNIGQIGDLVKGLAEGAKIMADPKLSKAIGKPGTITGDFVVGDDGSGVAWNIQKLVCSNLAVFLELGKKIEELGVYEAFHDEVVQDVMRGGKRTINKTVRVSEGKQSYIAMAVNAAAGIGAVITNLADGYKNMNETFPTDKKMIEGTSRVTRSIVAIMTAFSSIGEAMLYDQTSVLDLIPAAMGDSEMTKLFGRVTGLSPLNVKPGDNPFELASANIKTIVDTVVSGSGSISGAMSAINDFYKNSVQVMHTAINLATIGLIYDDYDKDHILYAYHNGQKDPVEYKMNEMNYLSLNNAKTNAGIIKETVNILSRAVPYITRLTPVAGNSFVAFSTQMAKGMKTLTAASTNIVHATKFVQTLQSAVKENVFNNISANTERIASAINSIDNEIFEPYAQMIGALGIMTDKHGEFIKMQKDLFELLEKIINKINEQGSVTVSGGETTGTTASAQAPAAAASKPAPAQTQLKQQQLTARLTPSKVTLEYADFIEAFKRAVAEIRFND